jgi:predicted RNase H-like nuclease (RuvC/YqgF family)
MSTAKERYYSLIEDFEIGVLQEIIDYVTELEHSLQDSEERCKLFEDSGILLSKRITELEQQVEELKKENKALKDLIRYSRE